MRPPLLSERLLLAVQTEKEDMQALGLDFTPRVRQRFDAMIDAIGIVEAAEKQAARLAVIQATSVSKPSPWFRDWLADWKRGGRT